MNCFQVGRGVHTDYIGIGAILVSQVFHHLLQIKFV